MVLKAIKLIVLLEVVEEMKKKRGLKNDFSHTEMILVNGHQKISVRNYGTFLMEKCSKVSISGYSP